MGKLISFSRIKFDCFFLVHTLYLVGLLQMQNAKTEKIKIRIKEIEIDICSYTDLEISIQLLRQMSE